MIHTILTTARAAIADELAAHPERYARVTQDLAVTTAMMAWMAHLLDPDPPEWLEARLTEAERGRP